MKGVPCNKTSSSLLISSASPSAIGYRPLIFNDKNIHPNVSKVINERIKKSKNHVPAKPSKLETMNHPIVPK